MTASPAAQQPRVGHACMRMALQSPCSAGARPAWLTPHAGAPLAALARPPGGYFIGTVPDGKRVGAHLKQASEVDEPMLRLARKWEVRRGAAAPSGARAWRRARAICMQGPGLLRLCALLPKKFSF